MVYVQAAVARVSASQCEMRCERRIDTDPYLQIVSRKPDFCQPAALDVTVISTLQSLTLSGAASTPGHALSVAAERKRTAHATACHSVGITFIPLVVESLGGWGPEAISTLKDIGRLQGQRLGTPPSLATRHLFQRLAIRLWRGNATLWIGRLPIHSSEVDGVQ